MHAARKDKAELVARGIGRRRRSHGEFRRRAEQPGGGAEREKTARTPAAWRFNDEDANSDFANAFANLATQPATRPRVRKRREGDRWPATNGGEAS